MEQTILTMTAMVQNALTLDAEQKEFDALKLKQQKELAANETLNKRKKELDQKISESKEVKK